MTDGSRPLSIKRSRPLLFAMPASDGLSAGNGARSSQSSDPTWEWNALQLRLYKGSRFLQLSFYGRGHTNGFILLTSKVATFLFFPRNALTIACSTSPLRCGKRGLNMNATKTYPHRQNADGTVDSICTECYRTIGQAAMESELAPMEAVHVCFADLRPSSASRLELASA